MRLIGMIADGTTLKISEGGGSVHPVKPRLQRSDDSCHIRR